MIIKIPFKTPTINHLYGQRGSMRFLKREAKELKVKIKDIVNTYLETHSTGIPVGVVPVKVTTYIYEDWYCKNGTVKRVDIANREKFLIDSVFDALGIDDKFIFEHTMIKRQSTNNYAVIEISPL